MMRIPESDMLNIRVFVGRKGRIRVMGNHILLQLIRESRRMIRRLHVGKSEVGEGLLLL